MNKIVSTSVAIFICAVAFAQQMHVKQPNFATFNQQQKKAPALLDKMSSAMAKQHPEYGVLPFNSQCRECVELIDKRTIDGRFFIDPKNEGHSWSQKSYFPLHYKTDSNDVWHTIDQRLRPDATNTGVYVANNQPVPTKLDLNKRNTSLNLGEIEFSFNNNLTMYFFEPDKAYTQTQMSDYSHSHVGEEGLVVYNMWPGIDMRQVFTVGTIETNYAINSPLDIPVSDNGFMVIEDHFNIPDGYTFEEESPGLRSKENYYPGNYVLKNASGEVLVTYEKPIYTDHNAFGMHGSYNLLKTGNNFTLQMMVPVSWMKNPNNVYPIIIDPFIAGSTKLGNFHSTGLPSANMAFTTYTVDSGYCGYHMNVPVPGKSQFTGAYISEEWQLTYDNTCQAAPPAPSSMCTYNQVFQEVVCDSCGTVYPLSCANAMNPNYVGTCTINQNTPFDSIAPDTIPILTNPAFIGCYAPQCPQYLVPFTLRNSDSVCNESCGYLCARGNVWIMTIEAYRQPDSVYITEDKSTVCAGEPITHTAHPSGGFPPYYFEWIYGDRDTVIYDTNIFMLEPQQNTAVKCLVFDICGSFPNSGSGPYTDTIYSNILLDTVYSYGPTIRLSSDTLYSSNPTGNQWLLNDTVIPGAVSQNYVITQPGNYRLLGTDSANCAPFTLSVECNAFFIVFADSVNEGVYNGYNLSIGSNLEYMWSFGDGHTSNEEYPTHTYSQPGIYTVCLEVYDTASQCSSSYCDSTFYILRGEVSMSQLNILAPGTTGTTDLNNSTSVDIFPNPATNELAIIVHGFEPQFVSIFDLNGRKLTDGKFTRQLDISQLATGSYFIEVKGNEKTVRRRFEKE